jgi:quercetin dioxygenase-like cupin family protein
MKTLHVTNPIHRSPLRRALNLIAPVLVTIAAFAAAPARATPACAIATDFIVGSSTHGAPFPNGLLNLMCNEFDQYGWFLKMMVKGDSELYVVRNTFPVGAHTGWHTHPGPSLITVISGELTVYEADSCNAPVVYHAGETFTDIGCGDVHLVRNEGTVCAVNIAVQIVPAGQPRRIDASQPANCPAVACASPTPCPQ